jgi:N-carbamoyl-L-amino-acid hydrolase
MLVCLGVVLGTYGVERHQVTWRGQAAHAGSTPMDKRRDALASAAKLALEICPIAARVGEGAVCTSGGVVTRPGIVTSVVETAEQLLDQRHLDCSSCRASAVSRTRSSRTRSLSIWS